MSQSEFDKILREAADSADFQMPDAHLNQAMNMINAKKKRRFGFFWLWSALAIIGISGILYSVGFLSTTSEVSTLAKQDIEESVSEQSIASTELEKAEATTEIKQTQNTQVETTNSNSNKEVNNTVNREVTSITTTTGSDVEEINDDVVNNRNSEFNKNKDIPTPLASEGENLSMSNDEAIITLAEMPILSAERIAIDVPVLPTLKEVGFLTLEEKGNSLKSHKIKKVHYPTIGLLFNALSSNTSYGTGIQELNLGMYWRKHWNKNLYYSIEPSVQFSLPSEDFALVQAVNNYGLEVSTEYYGIQADIIMSGKLNLNLGWEKGRWSVQGGPTAHFLPFGYGEVTRLRADDGNFVKEATLGTGWLAQDLTSTILLGADAAVQYQVSPRMDLGFQLNYRAQGFLNKNEVRAETEITPWAVGLRLQYRIR